MIEEVRSQYREVKGQIKKRYRKEKTQLRLKRRYRYKFERDLIGLSLIFSVGLIMGYIEGFTVTGLLMSSAGAIIVLLPRVSSADLYFTDSDRLEALDMGYHVFLEAGFIIPEIDHFDEIWDFFYERRPSVRKDEQPEELTTRDPLTTDEEAYHSIFPLIWVKYPSEDEYWVVGNVYTINNLVNKEIRRLESQGQRRLLHIGMVVLATGFLLQLISQI